MARYTQEEEGFGELIAFVGSVQEAQERLAQRWIGRRVRLVKEMGTARKY